MIALADIQHPIRCAVLITKLKRMLHGRQCCLHRKQISSQAAHLETLRAQGRIGHPGITYYPQGGYHHGPRGNPQPGHGPLHASEDRFSWVELSQDRDGFLSHTIDRSIPPTLAASCGRHSCIDGEPQCSKKLPCVRHQLVPPTEDGRGQPRQVGQSV